MNTRNLAAEKQKRQMQAAQRALEEAKVRREQQSHAQAEQPAREVGGREGLDPVRYGDWEKNGLICDF